MIEVKHFGITKEYNKFRPSPYKIEMDLCYVLEDDFFNRVYDDIKEKAGKDLSFTLLTETDNKFDGQVKTFKNCNLEYSEALCNLCNFKMKAKQGHFTPYQKSRIKGHLEKNDSHEITISMTWNSTNVV